MPFTGSQPTFLATGACCLPGARRRSPEILRPLADHEFALAYVNARPLRSSSAAAVAAHGDRS
jgi:hypothetical protein